MLGLDDLCPGINTWQEYGEMDRRTESSFVE